MLSLLGTTCRAKLEPGSQIDDLDVTEVTICNRKSSSQKLGCKAYFVLQTKERKLGKGGGGLVGTNGHCFARASTTKQAAPDDPPSSIPSSHVCMPHRFLAYGKPFVGSPHSVGSAAPRGSRLFPRQMPGLIPGRYMFLHTVQTSYPSSPHHADTYPDASGL
jgi:hypothetical protein